MGTSAKKATPIRPDLTHATGEDVADASADDTKDREDARSSATPSAERVEGKRGASENPDGASGGRYPYDKKRARLACVRHLPVSLPYEGKDVELTGQPDPLPVGRGRHVPGQGGSELSYAP